MAFFTLMRRPSRCARFPWSGRRGLRVIGWGCGVAMMGLGARAELPEPATARTLNDVHSRLNETRVAEVVRPVTVEEVVAAVRRARAEDRPVSIAGARHAMGGQQFARQALHLDMTGLNQVLSLDKERGLVTAQAGVTWPGLRAALEKLQPDDPAPWSIVQKQTGADELTLGGAVSANIHGRGLNWRPFVQDVASLTLVDAEGRVRRLSRDHEAELFRLVIGGYGLFGVITEVEVRLQRRQSLQRVVEITTLEGLARRVEQRIAEGYCLGDFQFCPDETSPGFLREGVFACYRPAEASAAAPAAERLGLSAEAWRALLVKAHHDKTAAWADYTGFYRRTHGQIYGSNLAQFNHYDPRYEEAVEAALPELPKGSLMISEVYVPRPRLEDFMAACAEDFRAHGVDVIYGTIRFIRADGETFLPWAREDFACIVFNLRVTHTADGVRKSADDFRRVIDRALERDGSFFLTYHRWAARAQMERAYPQFADFLQWKRRYDPEERFQSEWYRHWKKELAATP